MGEQERAERKQAEIEAAAWVVRLTDPDCTAVQREQFERWRDASLDNLVAFEREAATWEKLARLNAVYPACEPVPQPEKRVGAFARNIVSRGLGGRRWVAVAAAVLLVAGFGGASMLTTLAAPAYATEIGERRSVTLDDGSRIELNTDSEVIVRFRRDLRQVELKRGEAVFEVAGDHRPFEVLVGGRGVRTQRSEVAVRLLPQGPLVLVTRGSAEIVLEDEGVAGNARSILVPTGFQALAAATSPPRPQPVAAETTERMLAWRSGGVVFNGQSLAEAVAEFNRYNRLQLVIADPTIEDLRVGGYFQSSDMPGFVKAVTESFPVRAAQGEGVIYLSHRAPAR